jgi:hypothetical protein
MADLRAGLERTESQKKSQSDVAVAAKRFEDKALSIPRVGGSNPSERAKEIKYLRPIRSAMLPRKSVLGSVGKAPAIILLLQIIVAIIILLISGICGPRSPRRC